MMKKRYIHPTTEVIELDLSQPMLIGSLPLSDTGTDIQFAPDLDIEMGVMTNQLNFDK